MITENELIRAIDSIDLAVNTAIGEIVSKEMIPLWESEAAARSEGKKHSITLDYGKNYKVDRFITYHDGRDKKNSIPKYFNDGKWLKELPEDRSLFPLYHEDKISFAKDKWLPIHEGEKACDYALSRGLISVCFAGSLANDENYIKDKLILIKNSGVKGSIYFADNDQQGIKKAIKVRDLAFEIDFPFVILSIEKILWNAKKGDDFKEYSDSFPYHDSEMLKAQIESFIIQNKFDLINSSLSHKSECTEVISDTKVNKEAWLNIATKDLFKGHWISLNNILYKFNGSYYEEQETVIIKRMITNWCSNYTDEKGNKSKATPSCVENVFKWVNALFGVSPNQVNCEGIPLKNGYLTVTIIQETNKPKFDLKPYNHEVYFTYQSDVKYDPKASSESAIKLLECLDEPYKSLFIKSISTVLGFKEIRRRWDRIKALLLIGDGSNGKDTLREVISLILGEQGITSCSLNDFSQSRGFNIARLATNPKLNWSSENREINIDQIQALKQAITGDPLFIEGKGKDGFEVKLNTLFVFNSNHQPDLKGNQFAIQSRLTLIPFTKTYSMTPKIGELKADPRFKHDKEFLVNDVAVGFLNLLINAFGEVYQHGINYQESEQYFNEVITENNHLRQFVNDVGLEFTNDDTDRLTIGEIYSHLLEWYYKNGYCDFEDTKNDKKKTIWLIDDKKDPPIKASKNLSAKLLEIFPKAKVIRGKPVKIIGLGIKNAETINNKDSQGMSLGINRVFFGYKQGMSLGISEEKPQDSNKYHTQNLTQKQTEPNTQTHTQKIPKNDPKNTQKDTQENSQNPSKISPFDNLRYPKQKNNTTQKIGVSLEQRQLIEKFRKNNLGEFASDEQLLNVIGTYSGKTYHLLAEIPIELLKELLGEY
ncbi:DUF5906 domain-containing protein (plasmid) [Cyanobacterium aponinum AL20118]|uniref:DUF5906 domain-containing protein n=1 Tax=Cyanobacterium aponinum AL20115 TaxID=3090662 RepID=A0AAF0ZDQ4_9CHRO|nr:DUF5906 domain-containing protein [Cyanobacterium aponinum]WPF90516.1 DUF5906 domain-containing protein [Cyanobacterium aponinum AL20115]